MSFWVQWMQCILDIRVVFGKQLLQKKTYSYSYSYSSRRTPPPHRPLCQLLSAKLSLQLLNSWLPRRRVNSRSCSPPTRASPRCLPRSLVWEREGRPEFSPMRIVSLLLFLKSVFAFWSDIFLTSLRGQLNPARCWPCRYADAGSNFNYGYGWYM